MVMLTDNSYKVLNYGSKKIKKTILKFLGKKKKEDKPTPTYVKIGNNSPNYATKSKDPNRGNKVPGIHSSEYLTTTPRPSYMKKTDKAGPAKIKNSTIYQDSKPNVSNAPRPNFKAAVNKDTKKKKRMKLGRNTHNAAKKLMGGY
jgi:hypothetical protein